MRSIRMLAVVTGTLVLASGCGDGGGTAPPGNLAPVANFTPLSCTVNVPCAFTSTSTDDVAVTGWSWDFNGDAIPEFTTSSATFTFAAVGNPNVSLTVSDAAGLQNTKTAAVAVTAAGNTPPTAGFTVSCTAGVCTFTNTSTDVAPGTITYLWNFGDASATTDVKDPTHTYTVTAPTNFTVTLTVTDNEGAVDVETQTVPVTPPAAQLCSTVDTRVDCNLDVTQRATVTITLASEDCELGGNTFAMVLPRSQSIFFNGCSEPVGAQDVLRDANGAPMVFAAGSRIQTRFTRGNPGAGDPPAGPPAIRLEGSYPTWTLRIDDGGNPTAPGEPDFADIVLTVQATAAQ